MTDSPEATVVIASAARPDRVDAMKRAVASVLDQRPQPELIVVANGKTYDPGLVAWLEKHPGIRYEYLEAGGYPGAQRRGRELVRTPFFCFLDDDDELLPGAMAHRLGRAREADAPDIVVGHGWRNNGSGDYDYVPHRPAPGADLMRDLLIENWFASAAPLFRTETIGVDSFDGETKYFEWTLLAFRLLAAGRRMAIIDDRCFRLYDSPESLSKDPRGTLATPDILVTLLGMHLPAAVRAELRRRLAQAHHACSDLEHGRRRYVAAWRHHLRSLCLPGGLSYLAFTRHLIFPSRQRSS